MKKFSVEEISQIVGGMLTKAQDAEITMIAPPLLCDENMLALALGEEEINNLAKTKAKAALVPLGVNIDGITTIEVERPRLAMMKLLTLFYEEPRVNDGYHPTAVIHPEAQVAENAQIGANVVISKGAVIGEHTKILPNSYIGNNAKIGNNCFFGPNIAIYTALHSLVAKERELYFDKEKGYITDMEYAKPITIGNDCWFGGNVIVLPGVTIHDNVVVGAGSVVTHDLESGYVYAGNPVKKIKPITKEDSIFLKKELW